VVAVLFLTVFVILPIANVFSQAVGKGWQAYRQRFGAPEPAAPAIDPKLAYAQ